MVTVVEVVADSGAALVGLTGAADAEVVGVRVEGLDVVSGRVDGVDVVDAGVVGAGVEDTGALAGGGVPAGREGDGVAWVDTEACREQSVAAPHHMTVRAVAARTRRKRGRITPPRYVHWVTVPCRHGSRFVTRSTGG